MVQPAMTYVISSWSELGDGLTQMVVGVAFSEAQARQASEVYGRTRAIEDDPDRGSVPPLVWREKNVDGHVQYVRTEDGMCVVFFEAIVPLADTND